MDGDTNVTSKVCNYLKLGPPDTTSCFPLSYNPSTTAYYSPGRCHEGFTSACGRTTTSGIVTETADTCCPTYGCSQFKLKCLRNIGMSTDALFCHLKELETSLVSLSINSVPMADDLGLYIRIFFPLAHLSPPLQALVPPRKLR